MCCPLIFRCHFILLLDNRCSTTKEIGRGMAGVQGTAHQGASSETARQMPSEKPTALSVLRTGLTPLHQYRHDKMAGAEFQALLSTLAEALSRAALKTKT